jgi:hypothetical protein
LVEGVVAVANDPNCSRPEPRKGADPSGDLLNGVVRVGEISLEPVVSDA